MKYEVKEYKDTANGGKVLRAIYQDGQKLNPTEVAILLNALTDEVENLREVLKNLSAQKIEVVINNGPTPGATSTWGENLAVPREKRKVQR